MRQALFTRIFMAAVAAFLFSFSALANNIDNGTQGVDGLDAAVEQRNDEFKVRVGPDGDFPNSVRRFQEHGDMADPDTRARLRDTLDRYDDTNARYSDFRKQHGIEDENAGQDDAGQEQDSAAVEQDCETDIKSLRKLAKLAEADGQDLRGTGLEGWENDATVGVLPTGECAKSAAGEDAGETQQASVDAGKASETTSSGEGSPVGKYKLTWESDGIGDWNKQEPWHSGDDTDGYGDAAGKASNASGNGETITLRATKCNKDGKTMCGASITTRDKKEFTHGYVEVTAKYSDAKGLFPAALWLVGDGQWPNSGEIDGMESINNGRDDGKVYMTAHWAGGCDQWNHCSVSDSNAATLTNKNGWNTYGIERTHDAIHQYVNGKRTGTITRAQAAAKGGNYQVLFDKAMHIRADIGSGGAWAEHSSGQRDEGEMQIRDVKVYE